MLALQCTMHRYIVRLLDLALFSLFFIFQKVAEEVARLHDEFYTNKTLQEMAKVSTLQQLGSKYYSDSDLVDTLPKDLEFNT